VTDAQLAAERAEADAQKKADRHWKPLLAKWRGWLGEKSRRAEAERALVGVSDPRAVPSVWSVFALGDAVLQARGIEILGRIDAPGSSRALAMLAVFGRSAEVRRAATETLARRDPRDYVGLLVGLVRDPLKVKVRSVGGGLAGEGELLVEGPKYNVRRVYVIPEDTLLNMRVPGRLFTPNVPFDPFGPINMMLAMAGTQGATVTPVPSAAGSSGHAAPGVLSPALQAAALSAQQDIRIGQALLRNQEVLDAGRRQQADDIAAVEAYNAEARAVNAPALLALNALTGQDFGESSEVWRSWWTDQRGYAYQTTTPEEKPTYTSFVANPSQIAHSCFAAGTPVRTLEGPRPIESIRPGDRVLSQDGATGTLSYTPVVAVYHNRPAATLKIALGDQTIVATGIHRFWKAGKGWTMARDLKPGDVLRTLGGTAQVTAIEDDTVQPVFNLEVAEGQSFFVGASGLLAHDNSLVRPVSAPFDAAPELAAAATP
jgi:hypothetical protein